ncbi:Quinic acid utilization activator [Tolypocladium paradoxum]|uniref:Quinic acid utilization activator n=1 Tax=Tolypocladium paradoxum TaxID=94208 RepID=A0A2S4KYQ1_9HYPO|nr:Quinic acid utilization activator [Tolypocladium paradoxum]
MSASPPPSPSQQHANAHAYASNGLEILQAASDAAQAIHNPQALQNAAAAASEALPPATGAPTATGTATGTATEMPHHLMAAPGGVMRDPTINPKLTRLRRACDMCSMRKVKCDDTNIPCRPCRELGVDCTYERETKRRGPPNKHAEAAKAAKRARLDLGPGPGAAAMPVSGLSASPSPQNAAKTLMNISSVASDGILDAETIAPMPVLELLVDDFFTYIHPLAPFPHEPTFRQSFANRQDRTKPEFLGLLASMMAALVASFPRSAREHLKAQHSAHLFPKAIVMIEKCRDIALLTRGSKWVLKQPKTLDDAATSYFLGLASGYTHQWNASRHFMAETLTLIRELGFSRPKHPGDLPTFGSDTLSPDPLPFNHVKDQTGKRIFWCLLLGVRSFSQLGASHTDLVIAPSTPSLPYPSYPENVDDICVLANEIVQQAEGSVTLLTGFRFGIDIYTTMNGVVSLELAYGMSTLPWADQRLLLRDGLLAAKSIIDNLPPELQLGNHGDEANSLASLDESGLQYVPPVWPNTQPPHDLRNVIKSQPLRRRQLQYEIQKANIFVSQLATRSYFVELYFNLRDVHVNDEQHSNPVQGPSEEEKALQDADDKEILDFMSDERELMVQDLLTVLGSISQRNLEPNGGSLINKIRQVASTLLNDAPERKGPFAVKAEEALSQLVDVLMKLEKPGPAGESMAADPSHMTAEDEEEELRHWADLRDYQLRFAANGGFAGDL